MQVTEADDRDHPAEVEVDAIDIEFVAADLSIAGLFRMEARRAAGATRFLAAVLRPNADPVVVIDYDLPLPRSSFEFRAPGVWAEFCAEQPLDHWTIGLEAFGLSVSAREVATPETYGDRTPVGLDLELETMVPPEGDASSFEIGCRVHGDVLLADEVHEIDGIGVRRRRRDGRRATSTAVVDAPRILGEVTLGWPPADGLPVIERRGWFGGSRPAWTALPLQSLA